MHKAPFVFPILGGRKVEHLQGNIDALSISLTPQQIEYIDGILPFAKGFPEAVIVRYLLFDGFLVPFFH